MGEQRNRTSTAGPWTAPAVAFVGVLAGAGISSALGAHDPWTVVITAVTVAVVFLLGRAISDRRSRSPR